MKTSKYLKTIAFCALMLAAAMPGKAQVFPNTYINIDWQVGVPLGAGFADKAERLSVSKLQVYVVQGVYSAVFGVIGYA